VTLMVYFLGGLLIYGDHFLSHNQSAVRVESERSYVKKLLPLSSILLLPFSSIFVFC
jgi:hypothetical protein